MKVLPEIDKRRSSKVVIGDKNGVINCLGTKKKEVAVCMSTSYDSKK